MKKLGILLLLFVFPMVVNAASINVKSLDASASGKAIKYSGEMESGSVAVMCKLYNGEDTEVDYLSSSVVSSKFEGTFTVSDAGKYKVSCANYEGGEIKSVDVEVKEEATPATLDNIITYLILGIISLSLIVGIGMYFKKQAR